MANVTSVTGMARGGEIPGENWRRLPSGGGGGAGGCQRAKATFQSISWHFSNEQPLDIFCTRLFNIGYW